MHLIGAVCASMLAVAVGKSSHGCGLLGAEQPQNRSSAVWTEDPALRSQAQQRFGVPPVTPSTFKVNLDLPAEQRWLAIGKHFADKSSLIQQYFETFLPAWVLKVLIPIFGHEDGYKGFGAQFSAEMKGYAAGLGIDVGYVVAANLVYQLEHLGVNCSNWNVTGPTPNCPKKGLAWFSSPHYVAKQQKPGPAGICTSIVAEDATGTIMHGRNLDWSLPQEFRELVINIDFERGGSLLYHGTTIVSFVGVLAGLSPASASGFSYSNDARCQGGILISNLLKALTTGAQTPCHHARTVFESATNFDRAVQEFSSGALIDPIYYIVGGTKTGEGAVVARDRSKAVDVWRLNTTGAQVSDGVRTARLHDVATDDDWFLLQTNYDHWVPVPAEDDRRTPGIAHMRALGRDHVTKEGMWSVLKQWPTFNLHTDFSAVMSAAADTYDTLVWMDK